METEVNGMESLLNAAAETVQNAAILRLIDVSEDVE